MKNNFLEQTIVKHLAGSQAYGTSTPESDTDYRGIFLANKEYILTPFFNVKEVSDTSEEDTKFYEINQYLSLYTEANPNILESLWVKPEHIVESSEIYDYLRSFNQQLLSSKIAHSYSGYAYNQVKRMSNHHGWLDKERIAERKLNEILEEHPVDEVLSWMYDTFPQYLVDRLNKSNLHPFNATKIDFEKYMRDTSLQLVSTQALKQYHFVRLVHNYSTDKVLDRDFNLLNYNSGYELIHYGENIFGVIINPNESTVNADGSLRYFNKERTTEELKVRPELIVKFNEKEYKENSENRKSYHKWKQNRNAKRAILESHHGYDCKHAMHTIRLLNTAQEALETGIIQVHRPDAAMLMDIRNGKWLYQEVMDYFNEKVDYIRNVAYHKTHLPKRPNIKLATKVLLDIREMQWYSKK
ncbi:TPA: nucleotidyltransferase domain-containing protein [Escherichia coli]|nr:nucleotidyltransferase domain-containing protein [Escherichia coli]HCJ8666378.1 nucleotidyltransferase domain-containing protein [Escherichia coli]